MPAGRPSKYDAEEHCKLAVAHGTDGKTYTAIANAIGITRDTLYRWMDEHPEFSDAMKKSRELAMQWWEERMQSMALTGEGNATAMIFAMKNQFPDDYKDRKEHKVEADLELYHELDFTGYQPSESTEETS